MASWGMSEPDSRMGTSQAMRNGGAPDRPEQPCQHDFGRDQLIANLRQHLAAQHQKEVAWYNLACIVTDFGARAGILFVCHQRIQTIELGFVSYHREEPTS